MATIANSSLVFKRDGSTATVLGLSAADIAQLKADHTTLNTIAPSGELAHATNTSYGVVKLAVDTDTEADYAVDAAVLTSAVGDSTEHFGGSAVESGTLTERFNALGGALLTSAIKNGAYGVATAMTGNTVDLSMGSVFTKTSTGAFTLSVTNTANYACVFTLVLTNGGVGTVTWPANTLWAEGTPPTLQASGVDVLSFLSVNNGATWFGVTTCTNAA